MPSDPDVSPYVPRVPARSRFVDVRGLSHHVLEWGEPERDGRPPIVMAHGWMDVAASFQFVVDALSEGRHAIAFDWRGFGRSATPQADTYYFHEYLGDLDGMLDAVAGRDGAPVDLLGHSMGANIAMLYAGVRPERIRRLVNLEGFGTPRNVAEQAPKRMASWLASLRDGERLKDYDSLDAVAARLCKNDPLLRRDRALWLATQWSAPVDGGGAARRLLADVNHKRNSPQLPNVDDYLACWKRITAPVLWIEGDRSDLAVWWGERYARPEFYERLALVRSVERHVVAPAGHMLHHDRPDDVARLVEAFLARADVVVRAA